MTHEDKSEIKNRFDRYLQGKINKHSYGYALGHAESVVRFMIEDVLGAAEYVAKLLDNAKQE